MKPGKFRTVALAPMALVAFSGVIYVAVFSFGLPRGAGLLLVLVGMTAMLVTVLVGESKRRAKLQSSDDNTETAPPRDP